MAGDGLAIGTTPSKVAFKPGDPVTADEWVENPVWVNVASSNVAGISYDKENKNLFVEFSKGSVYVYYGVPKAIAKDMFLANSMGKFVHRYLKNKYAYRQIK